MPGPGTGNGLSDTAIFSLKSRKGHGSGVAASPSCGRLVACLREAVRPSRPDDEERILEESSNCLEPLTLGLSNYSFQLCNGSRQKKQRGGDGTERTLCQSVAVWRHI